MRDDYDRGSFRKRLLSERDIVGLDRNLEAEIRAFYERERRHERMRANLLWFSVIAWVAIAIAAGFLLHH